jgi:hypothetical protein
MMFAESSPREPISGKKPAADVTFKASWFSGTSDDGLVDVFDKWGEG